MTAKPYDPQVLLHLGFDKYLMPLTHAAQVMGMLHQSTKVESRWVKGQVLYGSGPPKVQVETPVDVTIITHPDGDMISLYLNAMDTALKMVGDEEFKMTPFEEWLKTVTD